MTATATQGHGEPKTRLDIAGEIYYLQLQGQSLHPLFQQREDYPVFIEMMAAAARQERIQVLGYCLLNQSIHLLISPQHQASSEHSSYTFIRKLNGNYTRYYNEQHNRHGSVFQTQFTCTLIEPRRYLANAIAMLHRLPQQYGLVAEASIYPWSSHNLYLSNDSLGHNTNNSDWFNTTTALQLIAKQRSAQQRQYQNFINQCTQSELDNIDWNNGCHPGYFALASEQYIAKRLPLEPETSPQKTTLAVLTLAVCREYGIKPKELLQQRRHRLRLDACAQIVKLAHSWGIAPKDKSCRFLGCDSEVIEGTLRRISAESDSRSFQLERKLSRQLNISAETFERRSETIGKTTSAPAISAAQTEKLAPQTSPLAPQTTE